MPQSIERPRFQGWDIARRGSCGHLAFVIQPGREALWSSPNGQPCARGTLVSGSGPSARARTAEWDRPAATPTGQCLGPAWKCLQTQETCLVKAQTQMAARSRPKAEGTNAYKQNLNSLADGWPLNGHESGPWSYVFHALSKGPATPEIAEVPAKHTSQQSTLTTVRESGCPRPVEPHLSNSILRSPSISKHLEAKAITPKPQNDHALTSCLRDVVISLQLHVPGGRVRHIT